MWSAPREDHNRIFFVLMAALIALAWLALWVLGRAPDGPFYSHHGGGLDAFGGGGAFMLVFISGWIVMIVAMMLPTSLPLITLFRTITSRRQDHTLLVALLVIGYLGIWTAFGGAVYFGGRVLRWIVEQSAWLETNAWILGTGVILLAGLYQFTPLKYKCLEKCRSPLSFVMEHWRGSRERSQAFRLGVHHGLFCVGCCWSLMLLMFLVGGVGSFGWMLVLGAVMAVEKNVSWGRRIGAPLGAILIGLGLTLGTASALQPPTTAEVSLAPTNHSGMNGTATFTDTSGGVEVGLNVRDLPDPGALYLAHIHPGSCAGEPVEGDSEGPTHDHHADDQEGHASDHMHSHNEKASEQAHGDHGEAGEPADEIEYPLTPLVPDSEDNGSSTSLVRSATVAELFSGGNYYINVHAEVTGSEELPDSIGCGDLRRSN